MKSRFFNVVVTDVVMSITDAVMKYEANSIKDKQVEYKPIAGTIGCMRPVKEDNSITFRK